MSPACGRKCIKGTTKTELNKYQRQDHLDHVIRSIHSLFVTKSNGVVVDTYIRVRTCALIKGVLRDIAKRHFKEDLDGTKLFHYPYKLEDAPDVELLEKRQAMLRAFR